MSHALTRFTNAYEEALYFTETGDRDQPSAEAHLTALTRCNLLNTCAGFWRAWGDLIEAAGVTPEQAGHDFWLTRNGHGTGFWDRPKTMYGEELAALLTRASSQAGGVWPEFEEEVTA